MRFVLLCCLLLTSTARILAEETQLQFLHFNDLYQLYPSNQSGGIPALKKLIDEHRAKNPATFVSFGGDIMPSNVNLIPANCETAVQFIGQMNPDAAVFGNHEFDSGVKDLKSCLAKSPFPWLSSNITDPENSAIFAKKYIIKKMNGLQVGIFSITTPETKNLSVPENIRFAPTVSSAQAMVDKLKSEGADFILALTHLNNDEDVDLAIKVPEINLILGAHEHTAFTQEVGKTLVVKAGMDAEYLAVIEAIFDSKIGAQSLRWNWKLISTARMPVDKNLLSKLDSFQKEHIGLLSETLGQIAQELTSQSQIMRSKENLFGNFIVDGMRAYYQSDLGILNGGAIRGNTIYPAPVVFNRSLVYKELPFRNYCVLTSIKGKDLTPVLEHMLNHVNKSQNPLYPQLSGMTIHTKQLKNKKIVVSKIEIQGKAVQKDKSYTLALSDYLLRGGDHFPGHLLKIEQHSSRESILISDTLIEYIKKLPSPISIPQTKRILSL